MRGRPLSKASHPTFCVRAVPFLQLRRHYMTHLSVMARLHLPVQPPCALHQAKPLGVLTPHARKPPPLRTHSAILSVRGYRHYLCYPVELLWISLPHDRVHDNVARISCLPQCLVSAHSSWDAVGVGPCNAWQRCGYTVVLGFRTPW